MIRCDIVRTIFTIMLLLKFRKNNLDINTMINDNKGTNVLSLESLLAKSRVGLQQLKSWANWVVDAAG